MAGRRQGGVGLPAQAGEVNLTPFNSPFRRGTVLPPLEKGVGGIIFQQKI